MTAADWLSFPEAMDRILERVSPLGAERVPLDRALGRALAEPIVSPVDHPPWDNSAMDGFAVVASDVAGASRDDPVTLPISADIPAGSFPDAPIEPGTAVRVMTGAPVPEGATGVIRVEHTDGGAGGRVRVYDDDDATRHIRRAGEDIRRGTRLLAAGDEVTPSAVALLSLAGEAEPRVGRRPRVGVLANGDELAGFDDYDEVRAGRKVMNTNGSALAAQLRAAGAEPVDLGIARDDPASLRERIERGAGCDAILSAAGVSVGDHDYVREVLDELGWERVFWRVRMRPGSACLFAMSGGRPFWGVPGNPVSAIVAFETLVRPAVRALAGHRDVVRRPLRALAAQPVRAPRDVTSFLRVSVESARSGGLRARLTGPQGSGMLSSMSADALLVVPEGVESIEEGAEVDLIPLRDWLVPPARERARG